MAGACSRNPKAQLQLLPSPRLHFQDLFAAGFQVALESSSDVPSGGCYSPSSPLMLPRPVLGHLLLPPQTVQESESWHSAVKSWLPCENPLKHNVMYSSGKHGQGTLMYIGL